MGGVFIGVLRSGTIGAVRDALHGLDVDLSEELALPTSDPYDAPPSPPSPPVGAPGLEGPQQFGDVTIVWAGGVPQYAVQNSHPENRAAVPAEFWNAVTRHMPQHVWNEFVGLGFFESSFREAVPSYFNQFGTEDSWGALQINRKAWPDATLEEITTYDGNLRWARIIFDQQGFSAWYNSAVKMGIYQPD